MDTIETVDTVLPVEEEVVVDESVAAVPDAEEITMTINIEVKENAAPPVQAVFAGVASVSE